MDTIDDQQCLTRAQFTRALQVHPGTVSRWIAADPKMRVEQLGPTGHRVHFHLDGPERRRTTEAAGEYTAATV